MGAMFVTGMDSESKFIGSGNIFAYFQEALSSILNYGGDATAIVPPTVQYNGYSLHHIAGKNILDACMDCNSNELTFFAFRNQYQELDYDTSQIVTRVQNHYYYLRTGKVFYYSEISEFPFSAHRNHTDVSHFDASMGLPTSFSKIPVAGMDIVGNDDMTYRGSPYLFPLAADCLKVAFAAAKLDYLIDFVLPPILIHNGSRLVSIENSDWRGINIGPADKLDYLTYEGPVLKAGEEQLERYLQEIQVQLPSYRNTSNTAYEARLVEEHSEMTKVFLLERFGNYCTDILNLANEYSLATDVSINDLSIIFEYGSDALSEDLPEPPQPPNF